MARPGTTMALGLVAARRRTRGFWRVVLPELRSMGRTVTLPDLSGVEDLRRAEAKVLSDALARQLDAQTLGEPASVRPCRCGGNCNEFDLPEIEYVEGAFGRFGGLVS
jgi:hypothetical protein